MTADSRPTIRVKLFSYQSKNAEKEENVKIEVSLDDLARTVWRQATVVEIDDA